MTGSAIRREATGSIIALTLDEPLVSIHRLRIGDTHIEASRLVVHRIRCLSGQDVVGFPVIRVVEIPEEATGQVVRYYRLTERTEGHLIREHIGR